MTTSTVGIGVGGREPFLDRWQVEMDAVAVAIEGLRVVRGGQEVVHSVSLSIRTGSITGLLGPSGCGKTTLMRAVMGIQIVQSGTVTVLGLPAGSVALRHRIGYAPQSPSVYSDLTIRENLRYFSALLGAHVGNIDRVIEEVDLVTHRDTPVGRLSGGQRSRVSLAAALLGSPQLLVLDEPTVGLDPVLREELWNLFHRLRELRSVTLLVSSHVMDEAGRCDDLILMRDGAILAHEPPNVLRRRTGTEDLEQAFLHLIRGVPRDEAAI